jgi:hypothetical protein
MEGHDKEVRRNDWRNSWIAFIQDPKTQPFASKPVFPRIGVSGARVTSLDLERQLSRHGDDEEANASDGLNDDVSVSV